VPVVPTSKLPSPGRSGQKFIAKFPQDLDRIRRRYIYQMGGHKTIRGGNELIGTPKICFVHGFIVTDIFADSLRRQRLKGHSTGEKNKFFSVMLKFGEGFTLCRLIIDLHEIPIDTID